MLLRAPQIPWLDRDFGLVNAGPCRSQPARPATAQRLHARGGVRACETMARMRQSSASSAPLTSTWPPANELPHSATRDESTSSASWRSRPGGSRII
jgi:hypothetical protein